MVDYCISRFKKKQEQKYYRMYITDALMTLNNNFATCFGGTTIITRFNDVFNPPKQRNAAEIIADVMAKAGLRFAGDEK